MKELIWLDNQTDSFPPVNLALREPNGLLAVGGQLTSERLLKAYQNGIFPWFNEQDPILWWSPDPRAVLFPEQIKISKSLHKLLKQKKYHVTMDLAFEEVISNCAQTSRPGEINGTWLNPDMIAAYTQLHHQQFAHSIEVWNTRQELVGGLYGIALDKIFFGESMFSLESNTSKIALVYLCGQLLKWQFKLIDCQIESQHLTSMGATLISRDKFTENLKSSLKSIKPQTWQLSWHYCDAKF